MSSSPSARGGSWAGTTEAGARGAGSVPTARPPPGSPPALPQRWLPAACQPLNKGSERPGMWQQAQPGQTDANGHTAGRGEPNVPPGSKAQSWRPQARAQCSGLGARSSSFGLGLVLMVIPPSAPVAGCPTSGEASKPSQLEQVK